jgi:hypothetical protein
MRSNTHKIITEKILDTLNISGSIGNEIITGATEADTILEKVMLRHYFTANSPEMSAALGNIMRQLEKNTPRAIGVACHLAQDVAVPVHAQPLAFIDHVQWEGWIDKHISALMEDVYVSTDLSYYPELLLVYNEIANRSFSMLDDMKKAWACDKKVFQAMAVECIQSGVNGSVFIIENWERLK